MSPINKPIYMKQLESSISSMPKFNQGLQAFGLHQDITVNLYNKQLMAENATFITDLHIQINEVEWNNQQ